MEQGRGSGSNLPAEYVDPWLLLRRDLAAVAASTRLRARELWRRNRQADLWRPPIWPEALAPWFWPLLLILLLSLLALVPIGLNRLRAGAPAAAAPPPASAGSVPSPPTQESPPDQGTPGIAARRIAAPQSSPEETPASQSPPLEPAPPEAALPPLPLLSPPSPPPARDPLLVALERDGAPLLLLEASPLPARGLLRLTVAPAYGRLREEQRWQRALAWWARAQEQGYEHMELRDSRGWLQARSALVGEGLVLFDNGGAEDG